MSYENSDTLSISFNRFMETEDVTNPSHIVAKLLESKNNGTVIGILSPILSSVMVLTCVKELFFDDQLLVEIMPYDTNGQILPATRIYLHEIKSVKPFTSKFQNPFVAKLSEGDGLKNMLA